MPRVAPALLLAAGLLLPAPAPAFPGDKDSPAESSPESAGAEENRITPEQQAAIDRGLAWLKTRQMPDGSFNDAGGGKTSVTMDYRTALTALATLSFLGAGEGLRHGQYRDTVRRAVRWLLDAQGGSSFKGYISKQGDSQSKMHGHGFATMALAEAYGTAGSAALRDSGESRDPDERELRILAQDLRRGIQAAVDCIEKSQSLQGGWYYVPSETGVSDHEGSVTVCEVQALLAASNRGFVVSMDRIRKARDYMKRSQAASGGFKYQLSTIESDQSRESFALTAAGITTIVGLAEYDRRDALQRAYDYLDRQRRPDFDGSQQYAFYGSFYGVQAYRLAGGNRWKNYWIPLRRTILRRQLPATAGDRAGSWEGSDTMIDLGDVYPTAFSLLMLEVPIGYLSVYAK